jgi:hypothetical protein
MQSASHSRSLFGCGLGLSALWCVGLMVRTAEFEPSVQHFLYVSQNGAEEGISAPIYRYI